VGTAVKLTPSSRWLMGIWLTGVVGVAASPHTGAINVGKAAIGDSPQLVSKAVNSKQ
jgi:hypothetical protein